MSKKIEITDDRMAQVFNEWVKRYAEDPNAFMNTLDDDGNPIADYGERCTTYFMRLESEVN